MKDLHDTCLEIENSLPLWAGGDLEPHAQATVGHHLAVCERCSRSAARARAARAALYEGMQVEAEGMGSGRDPWPAIRRTLRAEGLVGSTQVSRTARTAFPRLSRRWQLAAALLVGFFIAGTWLPSRPSSDTPPVVVRPAEGIRNPVGPLVQVADVAGSPIPVLPAGLHRVAPGAPRLRDSALVFRVNPPASPDEVGGSATGTLTPPSNNRGGSPVSLERVQLLPPR
jgi:hypothetical protein